MKIWGTKIEIERRRRILLSVWAYAYEIENDSLVDDKTFDKECMKVDPSLTTGSRQLDNFFKFQFNPFTGLWIHQHPDLQRIKQIYEKHFKI
jgi:hypothetical protein